MAEAKIELGQNVEIKENQNGNGNGVIRNTATSTEIALSDVVDVNGAELSKDGSTLTLGDSGIAADSIGSSVAIGQGARALPASGGDPRTTALGYQAAQNSEQFGLSALGYRSAQNNGGDFVSALGYRSAQNNGGDRVASLGYRSARDNGGDEVTATGHRSAEVNGGERVTAAGYRAAKENTGDGVIALGYQAAVSNSEDDIMIVTDQSGNRRMELDLSNGNLTIEGTLTTNASL